MPYAWHCAGMTSCWCLKLVLRLGVVRLLQDVCKQLVMVSLLWHVWCSCGGPLLHALLPFLRSVSCIVLTALSFAPCFHCRSAL
jgi:hypothetical protein